MKMNKKIGYMITTIVIAILILVGIMYWIDLNKMENDEPVIFSTWGRKYAPTELEKPTADKELEESNKNETYFYGKVIEASEKYIIVEPNEGEEERKSSDKISINLGESNDSIYTVGTNVKITYNGIILETYPAQIKPIQIEIKSLDDFEIIFSQRKDTKIKTILLKNETEKYSYNIYSFGGDVKIKIENKEYDLREALLKNQITMEEIIAKANKDLPNAISYDDGGSVEYHYETYTIIKVHNLEGNRDVYIGTQEMTLEDIR